MMVLLPTPIGLQDLASLVARQSFVPDTVRKRLASPFGALHAATYDMVRPLGTEMPRPPLFMLASFDPREADMTGAIERNRFMEFIAPERVYPSVNREDKGDRLVPAPLQGGAAPPPSPPYDISAPDETPAAPATADAAPADEGAQADAGTPSFDAVDASQIYFGAEPLGGEEARIEPWAPGEAPAPESPEANDPDLKHPAAVAGPAAATPGETIANKGEVTGEGHRPKSPAERLGLDGKARARAEKCLAEAVYFEARGEPVRGQIGVAQVVMNRVFSGYYPTNVCGVVYQNKGRHLACQFTFACDGIPDRVTEPDAWALAKRIARDTLDGKVWSKEVGKSTHYHAYWVHPSWVREMMKVYRLGVHTFYRPRAWGDGSDAPSWGDSAKAGEVKKLEKMSSAEKATARM